jgi:hypothetical protein
MKRPAPQAGYSGKPLAAKLGIKAGQRCLVVGEPSRYKKQLGELPGAATFVQDLRSPPNFIHLFCTELAELKRLLPSFRRQMPQDGMIWVSWPKQASDLPTTVTENVIREEALALGLVDVKVCAVDEVWSGLKLVIRRENRTRAGAAVK